MKRTIQNLIAALAIALLAPAAVSAQNTIVYVNGPSFPLPTLYEGNGASLDLNDDGIPDFSCVLGYFVCTADIPTSACSAQFYFTAESTNSLLHQQGRATILRWGDPVANMTPTNAAWSNPDPNTWLASYFFSPRNGTQGYGGPLAGAGVGYLGVRFIAADGLHYGWVRVRMPTGSDPSPVIVDWAYETRPATAIRAGVINSSGESVQFTVAFPNGGFGSLILNGDQLRSQLTLDGQFTSAKLVGRLPAHSKRKPIADLGQPLVSRTNYTSFFREVTLTRGEIKQLLSGASYISIDGGEVLGRISVLD